MSTKYPEFFAALARPFEAHEVKTRPGSGGKALSYVTASTVANRLDEVLGPEFWDFEVTPWGENSLIGTLVIRCPGGEVVRKSNVGGKAEMPAHDDDVKSAASDCLKRCAALLGVARYMYRDGVPDFARDATAPAGSNGHAPAPRPQTPAPARSHGTSDAPAPSPAGRDYGPPTNGRALFAWGKEQGERAGKDVIRFLDEWGAGRKLPRRFADWSEGDIAAGLAAAIGFLGDSAPQGNGTSAPARPAVDASEILRRTLDPGTAKGWAMLKDLEAATGYALSPAWRKEQLRQEMTYARDGTSPNGRSHKKGDVLDFVDMDADQLARFRRWAAGQVEALGGTTASAPVRSHGTNGDTAPDDPAVKRARNDLYRTCVDLAKLEHNLYDDEPEHRHVFEQMNRLVDSVSQGETIDRLKECVDVDLMRRAAEAGRSWLDARKRAAAPVPAGPGEPGLDDDEETPF